MRIIFLLITFSLLSLKIGAKNLLDLNQIDNNNVPTGWELKVRHGKADIHTDKKSLCMYSDDASFCIEHPIKSNVDDTPYLIWECKIEELPKEGSIYGPDDQAAQLFVGFDNKRCISYVWSTVDSIDSQESYYIPWIVNNKILVIKSGDQDIGKWIQFSRDIRTDYKRLFDENPPNDLTITGIRLQINSQHSNTTARSCTRLIELTKDIKSLPSH